MASSTNHSPRKIARESSFLGAIKKVVVAPLTWLAGQERDDNTPTKRRRDDPVVSDSASNDDEDDHHVRPKRMRMHSPPKAAPSGPYLDPPSAAFHQYRPKRRTPAPQVTRSSSLTLGLNRNTTRPNASRSTLSPIRLGRTMSIDPPLSQLYISREPSMPDVVMESNSGSTQIRESSMPASALTARPSFRMRSSLTPQPQPQPLPKQRQVSQPPPLTTLVNNPTFVRPPPTEDQAQPPTTLGNLAETVRSARSPVRQHSTLLFGTTYQEPPSRPAQTQPSQKALFELDVYKTPLVPTRLRTSAIAAASNSEIPSMFKSRRAGGIVLMDDDRRSEKKKRSHKSPHRNDSKPYAGAGGMKKLLARRKQEAEGDEDFSTAKADNDESMSSETTSTGIKANPEPITAKPPTDWFAAATAGGAAAASGSSLRVGRVKSSRNHIARPAARGKPKFSAAFDEEDDAMDPEEEARRKELEEAAKKIPDFNIPPGFSFAKPEATPLQQDLTNAKEPPIQSLPFSFAKPVPPPEPPKAESSQARKENSEGASMSSEKVDPARSLADAAPLAATSSSSSAATSSGVPNFFATSSLLSKPIETPSAPFSLVPSASSSPAPASTSVFNLATPNISTLAANDKENPFWDGGKKTIDEPPALPGVKSAAPAPLFGANVPEIKPSASAIPSFFGTSPPEVKVTAPSPGGPFGAGAPPSLPFSFAKPTAAESAPPATNNTSVPKPLFGAGPSASPLFPSTTTTEPPNDPQPASSLFGPASTVAQPDPSKASNTAPAPFSFGPAASPAVAAEAPKPLFGGPTVEAPKPSIPASGNPFSFGAPEKTDTAPKPALFSFGGAQEKKEEPKPSPFSFGAVPSTPPTNSASTGFSFKTDAPAGSPSPAPFSFGAGASTTPATENKPFSFGTPSSTPQPIQRPVTPKNNDEERMEESPTRELQPPGVPRPSLNFSFGMPSNGTSLFGGQTPAPASPSVAPPSPFSFGAPSSSAPNPFATAAKPEEPRPFSFGSAAPTPTATAAPFSFGPSTSTGGEAPRPNTTGGFGGFGGSSTPTTGAAPFSFGNNPPANPFGGPQPSSAPGSPSTFAQSSPFSFGAPSPAVSTAPFSFGSQPASPAATSSALPSTGGFGSTSGPAFGASSPSSPFSAPGQLAPSTSTGPGGTALFTIGAAPTPAPAGAARQIRKLPSRRPGGAKR